MERRMMMTNREELRYRSAWFHDFPSDVALESLLTAVHAYGLATGREGFVEPKKIDGFVELLKKTVVEEADKLLVKEAAELAEKLAEAEARVQGWVERADRAESAAAASSNAHGETLKDLAEVKKQLAEVNRKVASHEAEIGAAYSEIARLRTGRAYKAIVEERDEAVRTREEMLQTANHYAAMRTAALQERDSAREALNRIAGLIPIGCYPK